MGGPSVFKYDVFISYSREDVDVARLLQRELEDQGNLRVWRDERELRGGQRINRAIHQALDDSRKVIVLWSVHSVNSDWVNGEAETARRSEKAVSILIDELVEAPLPFRVRHTRSLHVVEQNFEELLKDLGWSGNDGNIPVNLFSSQATAADPPISPVEKRARGNLRFEDFSANDLRFGEQWLPFLSREKELRYLSQFADHDSPFLWWAVVGGGGMGKSRLAQELVFQLRAAGWKAEFLAHGPGNDDWIRNGRFRDWKPRRRTLLVVDYAARHGAYLNAFLAHFSITQPANRLRVLLLDRPGRMGPVFAQALNQDDVDQGQRKSVWRKLFRVDETLESGARPFDDHDFLQLKALHSNSWRESILQSALGWSDLEFPELPEEDDPFWSTLAKVTLRGRPLFLQLAAFALAANPKAFRFREASQLVDEILGVELRRWKAASGREGEWQTRFKRSVCRSILFITVCQGIDLTDFEMRQGLLDAADENGELNRADQDHLLSALQNIRGDRGRDESGLANTRLLRPLEPDLLGERLALLISQEAFGGFRFEDDSALKIILGAWRIRPSGVRDFLYLFSNDFGGMAEVYDWIDQIFRSAASCSDGQLREFPWLIGTIAVASRDHPALLEKANQVLDRLITQGCSSRILRTTIIGLAVAREMFFLAETSRVNQAGCALVDRTYEEIARIDAHMDRIIEHLDADQPDQAILISLTGVDVVSLDCRHWVLTGGDPKSWIARVRGLSARFPGEIQLKINFAKCLFNASVAYAEFGAWPEHGEVLNELKELCLGESSCEPINEVFAQAMFNFLNRQLDVDREKARSLFLEMEQVSSRHPDSRKIAEYESNAAYNLAHARILEVESIEDRIFDLAQRFPESRHIAGDLVELKSAMVMKWNADQRFDRMFDYFRQIREVGERWMDDPDIAYVFARSIYDPLNRSARTGDWKRVDELLGLIGELADRQPEHRNLKTEHTRCLFSDLINRVGMTEEDFFRKAALFDRQYSAAAADDFFEALLKIILTSDLSIERKQRLCEIVLPRVEDCIYKATTLEGSPIELRAADFVESVLTTARYKERNGGSFS